MAGVVAFEPRARCRGTFQWWWLIWVAAGLCTFLCGLGLGLASQAMVGGGGGLFGQLLGRPFGGKELVTILAVGVDQSNANGHGLSDTMMVAAVRPATSEISVVSIPRDSRVEIPGVGVRRINAAHSYGGMPLTQQTVELLLGIPIDYYIEVSVPGIVKLVDALGGVEIEVEKRMYYRDRSQGLLIDLQPGRQRLTGTQAMGYVRFRHDATGDLARMERQREFLRAALREVLAPSNVSRLPRLVQVFADTVNTNLTARDLLALKAIAERCGPEGVRTATLPGEPRTIRGQSMIVLDPDQVRDTVNRLLLGQGLAVRVLNGTHVDGLGARVAGLLEEAGCDIVEVANAAENTDTTLIVDHRSQTRRAERIASWLGRGVVSVAPRGDSPADVTVVVGRDLVGQVP